MAYIGRGLDKISNVEVLDNLTFDGTSTSFTLQKNSVNFTPSSANNILVSIDGVVQAGNFTCSGSTIDFGVAVSASSTCDFIIHYGVGVVTTPSDNSVTAAKIPNGTVSNAHLAGSIDLTSKVTGTLPIGNGGIGATTLAGAGLANTPAFSVRRNGDQSIGDGSWTKIQFNHEIYDSGDFDSATNYRFTVPSGQAGKYMFFVNAYVQYGTNGSTLRTAIYKNGSVEHLSIFPDGVGIAHNSITSAIMDLSATDYIEFYAWQNRGGNDNLQGPHTLAYGFKLIGA